MHPPTTTQKTGSNGMASHEPAPVAPTATSTPPESRGSLPNASTTKPRANETPATIDLRRIERALHKTLRPRESSRSWQMVTRTKVWPQSHARISSKEHWCDPATDTMLPGNAESSKVGSIAMLCNVGRGKK
eukprot:7376140-Prymnesium_polylepis.1